MDQAVTWTQDEQDEIRHAIELTSPGALNSPIEQDISQWARLVEDVEGTYTMTVDDA